MRYPDFYAAKRAEIPNYVTAVSNQGVLDQQAAEFNQKRRDAMIKAPIDAYKGYVDLTEHNPLGDAVRNWQNKRSANAMNQATAPGQTMPADTPIYQPTGARPPIDSGGAPPGKRLSMALARNRAETIVPGGVPGGGGFNMAGGKIAPQMGGPSPVSVMPPGSEMAGGAVNKMATTAAQKGTEAAVKGTEVAVKGADAAAKTAATVGSKVADVAGKVSGAAAIPLAAASAGLAYDREKNAGSDDARVIGKTVGSVAPTALLASAAPLAAAGPVGWAGIAALAAASLYGMIG